MKPSAHRPVRKSLMFNNQPNPVRSCFLALTYALLSFSLLIKQVRILPHFRLRAGEEEDKRQEPLNMELDGGGEGTGMNMTTQRDCGGEEDNISVLVIIPAILRKVLKTQAVLQYSPEVDGITTEGDTSRLLGNSSSKTLLQSPRVMFLLNSCLPLFPTCYLLRLKDGDLPVCRHIVIPHILLLARSSQPPAARIRMTHEMKTQCNETKNRGGRFKIRTSRKQHWLQLVKILSCQSSAFTLSHGNLPCLHCLEVNEMTMSHIKHENWINSQSCSSMF